MIRTLVTPVVLVSLLAVSAGPVPVAGAADSRVIAEPGAVLLLGNSFTRGLRKHLRSLFEAAGVRVYVKTRAKSGWTLERHAGHPRIDKTLASRPWDVVVLQEQSDGIDEDRYPSARVLDAKISALGASTVFFMTWRTRGSPLVDYDALHGEIGGTEGYVPITFELDASLAPVGWSFRQAIVADPAVDLWRRDEKHADDNGRYLAACTIYATITGESPVGIAWWPRKISDAGAAWLQQIAADTVLTDPSRWNIQTP